MWADYLNADEIDSLLEGYLQAVGEKLFFIRVQADKKPNMPQRTSRESFLWEMIHKNLILHFEAELNWLRQMRQDLQRIKGS